MSQKDRLPPFKISVGAVLMILLLLRLNPFSSFPRFICSELEEKVMTLAAYYRIRILEGSSMVATRAIIYSMYFLIIFSLVLFFVFSSVGILMVLIEVDESRKDIMFKFVLPLISILLTVIYVVRKWSGVKAMVRKLSP